MRTARKLLAAALSTVVLIVACSDEQQGPTEQLAPSQQALAVDVPGEHGPQMEGTWTGVQRALSAATTPIANTGASCAPEGVINSGLDPSLPTQTGRTWRNGVASTCAGKPYPGLYSGTFHYRTFGPFINGGTNTCATVNFNTGTCGVQVHMAAYKDSYDPTNQGANYLGDVGESLTQPFSFPIPDGHNYVLVAHNNFVPLTCDFSFDIENVPCDVTPPTIDLVVDPDMLWPPNHKMHLVASGISATDDFDPSPSLSVTVTSNEDVNGVGDGDTEEDWEVVDNSDGTFDVYVRAERSGTGDGRVYTITATATDAAGNTATETGTVTVPHDRGKGPK
ncbi:MAG: hypothetical protein GTN62_08430 [Gemmatimonadales bacterium]|nr:hypothetical protein [Gemmatimonadales bacterium]NIN50124.1 hypothetical protein [Gemmatimonadales bacterium]NIP07588.1 hypothetical protein [Gemmatimonadales bacterium]NIR01740.1 hypothetical protein [Gemmatimonadales bacterium]NIS65643.1 hypothetical protein [Gemmatimonadales bacterium]